MERLEYRRHTRREAAYVLLAGGLTAGGFVLFHHFVLPLPWQEEPWFAAIYVAILAVVSATLASYAALNVVANSEFVCELDDTRIRCCSPVEGCGESFSIYHADIVRIEKEDLSESHRWYLWDKAGCRHWLTENYGNPANKFVEALWEEYPHLME